MSAGRIPETSAPPLTPRELCPLWREVDECLPAARADSEQRLLPEHDVNVACFALARSLQATCRTGCARKDIYTCPALDAVERMLRILRDSHVHRPRLAGDSSERTAHVSVDLLVREAVQLQDTEARARLCERLADVLTSSCGEAGRK